MDTSKAAALLGQTDEERIIGALGREVAYWKAQATQWKDMAARLDVYIEQKNAHIEKLEKTIAYLRGR